MNGIHQVLAYADGVNLMDDGIRKIETNVNASINACKVISDIFKYLGFFIDKSKFYSRGNNM